MSTGLWVIVASGCQSHPSGTSSHDAETVPSSPAMVQFSVPPSLCAPSRSQMSIGDAGNGVVFTDSTFEELYPYFLRRSIPEGPKAALWLRCADRFVRWSGRLVSFTPQGVTLKQLGTTVTYDVSLLVDMPGRGRLATDYRVGDHVTYLGRLDHYDDVFRTLFLVHGQVIKKDLVEDLGVLPATR